MSVQDRVVLITGATSGIGLGLAHSFAANGAHVILNGLTAAQEMEETRKELEGQYGVSVRYAQADIKDEDAVSAMVSQCISELGRVDILINNAGMQHVAPIEEFPLMEWKCIMMMGSIAPLYMIRAVLPSMRERKWGRIVNIASAHALVASPYKSAYVASKHAMAGLTKAVALETAKEGITVNALAPGYVWTPLVEAQIPEAMKAHGMTEQEVKEKILLAAQPTGEFVTVEQIAAFARFLCSEQAASVTGAILPIDGGWTAR